MATALILAGHGSHISPRTAGVVWDSVDSLRERSAAGEVTACFWKESPSFRHVLDTVVGDQVVVVPVFTAQGFFTKTVIPAEMGLSGTITLRPGHTIHYTRTLGEHPYLGELVARRVARLVDLERLDPAQVAVAIIGHGTKRDSGSRDAVRQQVDALRQRHFAAEVVDAFLEDEPSIPSLYTRTTAPHIVAVPFFLAPGSHAGIDVPQALGVDPGEAASVVNGRHVYYTEPIGTDEAICDLILELAADALLPAPAAAYRIGSLSDSFAVTSFYPASPPHRSYEDSVWHNFSRAGRDLLVETVYRRGSLPFGQLLLTPAEVRPLTPGTAHRHPLEINTPRALRRIVRNTHFRPLATSNDLPGGWRVPVTSPEMLHAAVETVYPGAVTDWASHQRGQFETESLQTLAGRQVGKYSSVHRLPAARISEAVTAVCGRCVRHPTWFHGESPRGAIPCASACNYWLAAIKDKWA